MIKRECNQRNLYGGMYPNIPFGNTENQKDTSDPGRASVPNVQILRSFKGGSSLGGNSAHCRMAHVSASSRIAQKYMTHYHYVLTITLSETQIYTAQTC